MLIAGSIFIDIILILAFRFAGTMSIPLLLILAVINVAFYLFLLIRILRKTAKQPERYGFLLEFVCLHFFLCAGIFLFKLTDLMIIFNCK